MAGAGAIALNEFRGDIDRNTQTVTNETVAITPHTLAYMGNDYVTSIDSVYNATNGYLLGSAEYTLVDGSTATSRINVTNNTYSAGNFLVSYTHYQRDHAWNITGSGLEGVDNTMDFADTWGVIIGVVALITIVIGGFVMFRRT
jgi:hypothetical protein